MHKQYVNKKAKEKSRIISIVTLWLLNTKVLQAIVVPKDLIPLPVPPNLST